MSNRKPSAVGEPKRRNAIADFFLRLVKEKQLGAASAVVILILVFVAIFADALAPYPFYEVHPRDMLQGSSARYLMGTDQLGRDFLSRLIYGARISLLVGLSATMLNVVVAVLIGGTSGFFGGKFDLVVQRFVDAWVAFPALLILLTIMSIAGKGLLQIIMVLGISGGIGGSRIVRSAVIAVKENAYFQAAESIGSSKWRILIRHVMPNIAAPVIIIFTTRMGAAILTEATISFLGYGIPPPTPSWGGMLSGAGRRYMRVAPWMALWPGFALALTVYGINMFGDALRDILDPRLRGGLGRYSGVKAKRARKYEQVETEG